MKKKCERPQQDVNFILKMMAIVKTKANSMAQPRKLAQESAALSLFIMYTADPQCAI